MLRIDRRLRTVTQTIELVPFYYLTGFSFVTCWYQSLFGSIQFMLARLQWYRDVFYLDAVVTDVLIIFVAAIGYLVARFNL